MQMLASPVVTDSDVPKSSRILIWLNKYLFPEKSVSMSQPRAGGHKSYLKQPC